MAALLSEDLHHHPIMISQLLPTLVISRETLYSTSLQTGTMSQMIDQLGV